MGSQTSCATNAARSQAAKDWAAKAFYLARFSDQHVGRLLEERIREAIHGKFRPRNDRGQERQREICCQNNAVRRQENHPVFLSNIDEA